MITEKIIKEKGKCCVTDKSLQSSSSLTMVQLDIKVPWDCPVWGNFITGADHMGIAYVHDDAIIDDKLTSPIKYLVEFKGDEIIYHDINEFKNLNRLNP